MTLPSTLPSSLMQDWPKHYYEISDINLREACLLERLAGTSDSKADSEADQIRLFLLRQRFGNSPLPERIRKGMPLTISRPRPDLFLRAWLMLKASYHRGKPLFGKEKARAELCENLSALCIPSVSPGPHADSARYFPLLRAEWRNFAEVFLRSCMRDSAYRSPILGMFSVSDAQLATRIANEIDLVTQDIPGAFGLANDCADLRDIMLCAHAEHFSV